MRCRDAQGAQDEHSKDSLELNGRLDECNDTIWSLKTELRELQATHASLERRLQLETETMGKKVGIIDLLEQTVSKIKGEGEQVECGGGRGDERLLHGTGM